MFKLIISFALLGFIALASGEVEPGGLLNDLLKKAQQVNDVKGKELEVQILIKSSGQIINGLDTLIGEINNGTLSEGGRGNLATARNYLNDAEKALLAATEKLDDSFYKEARTYLELLQDEIRKLRIY